MSAAKIAITVDQELLRWVDRWVAQRRVASRSQVFRQTLREKVEHWKHSRLAEEVKKLNVKEERGLAKESFSADAWPVS